MNVTCCKIEADPIVATCGQGESCVAQCRASEGTLCPSGDCGNCLTFQEQPDEEEGDGVGEVGRHSESNKQGTKRSEEGERLAEDGEEDVEVHCKDRQVAKPEEKTHNGDDQDDG